MDDTSEENKDQNLAEEIECATEQIDDRLKFETLVVEDKPVDDNAFNHGIKDYLNRWKEFFDSHESGEDWFNKLKSKAIKGGFRTCSFRSVCWQVFLGCLSKDINKWEEELTTSRNEYSTIKEKHIFNPHDKSQAEDVQQENPLSQSDNSCWSQYFKNNELKSVIEKDVGRTSPETNFFHSDEIKTMMTNILVCYAQEHPSLSYQQGMHELLAPIISVRHWDLKSAAHAKDLETLPDIIHIVLKEEYMEHDSYEIFCRIMNATSSWYCVSEEVNEEETDSDDYEVKRSSPSLAITNKLNFIHNNLLANYDVELYHHLNRLQIIPQVYGLRWVRLLFGREFTFLDLLVLWDALFADSRALDLVDYVFVSMMISIRANLLASTSCPSMYLLMHYPRNIDVQAIIYHAMQLKKLTAERSSSEMAIAKKDGLLRGFNFNIFSTMSQKFMNMVSSSTKAQKDSDAFQSGGASGEPFHSDRNRSKSELDQRELKREMLWQEAMNLKTKITDLQEQIRFCSARVDASLNLLLPREKGDSPSQDEATSPDDASDESTKCSEEILSAIVGLKQVRDILNGSMSMSQVKSQEADTDATE